MKDIDVEMQKDIDSKIQVIECTREEGLEIFDNAAQKCMHMSGKEFLEAWDAGLFSGIEDTPSIIRVAMLIPFAR